MTLHHIGLAVDDIERMTEYIQGFAHVSQISETVFDEKQDAFLRLLTMDDGSRLELVQGKAVEKLVKKRQFFYHLCYETAERIEDGLAHFESAGGGDCDRGKGNRTFWRQTCCVCHDGCRTDRAS